MLTDSRVIIIHGNSSGLNPAMAKALQDAVHAGIEIVYTTETPPPPPKLVMLIKAPPRLPEIDFKFYRTPHSERAKPNQPWYAKRHRPNKCKR